MQTLTAPQGYRPGGTWGVCDRCGFKLRLSALATEWTGFKVCRECFDPRPYDLDPPRIYPEGLPVRAARPEHPVPLPDDAGDNSGLLYWWGIT